MDSARIAILCPGYGVVARGVETYIAEIVAGLRKLRPGWSFDIYCRVNSECVDTNTRLVHVPAVDRDGSLARIYAALGHRLRVFLRTRIDAECLSFTLAAVPRILAARYDVIINQAGPFAGTLLRSKRRLDGTPFVHNTASGFGDLELLMTRQRPDLVIATSPYAREWLEERISGIDIECVPNGVDRSIFRPFLPAETEAVLNNSDAFHLRRPIVLFVGAMDPMKRPELLISAMERVPDASLLMIGSGYIAQSVEKLGLSKLGRDRFLLIPKVSHKEMPVYYNLCDLFTLPSEEPYGLVFLEAMACNKPVLGQHSPVQKWLFGEAGSTCDCTNADEYAAAIHNLLSKDYGSLPRERTREFSWESIAERYAEMLPRVASSRRR